VIRRRILVIRQDRIGDAVLATGLPRELKKRWPGCTVCMLVRPYTAPLFENNPYVDEIIVDEYRPETRNSSFWRMVGELRRRRFTHALMLLPQARYNYMTFCAGIPFRLGHGIILFHALTLAWPVMTRKFRKGRHEAQYNLDLVRAMGVRTENATPEIHLTAEEKAQVEALRKQWRQRGKVVGINASSGWSSPNWQPASWARLATLLAAEESIQVVVTDFKVPPELADISGVEYPDQGQPIRSTVMSVAACDLYVAASTGPMHIAGALGVPTLSIFCPLPNCEPALWGPLGNEAAFVLPEKEYCRDHCPGNPHVCDFAGSFEVSPEQVAAGILAQLSSSS
jgi:heptosyltransferase-2